MEGEPATGGDDGRDEDEVRPHVALFATLAGVALLAILIAVIEPLRSGIGDAIGGNTDQLREDLRGLGVGGVVITFILALAHVFIWYPAEILDTAAGYVYGFWAGPRPGDGGLARQRPDRLLDRPSTRPGRCSTGSSAASASTASSRWWRPAARPSCSGSGWCR